MGETMAETETSTAVMVAATEKLATASAEQMAAASATRGERAGRTGRPTITKERSRGSGEEGAPVPNSSGSGGARRRRAEGPTHAKRGEPRGPKGGQSRQPSPSKQRPTDDKSPESPNEGLDMEADVLCPPVHGDGGGAEGKEKLDSVFGICNAGPVARQWASRLTRAISYQRLPRKR